MFIHCCVHEHGIAILENRLTATQMLDPESPCNLNSTPGHMVYITEGVLKQKPAHGHHRSSIHYNSGL